MPVVATNLQSLDAVLFFHYDVGAPGSVNGYNREKERLICNRLQNC